MAIINWKTLDYPELPFDQQLHIDQSETIYKYNATAQCWERYNTAYLKKQKELKISVNGRPITRCVLESVMEFTKGVTWKSEYWDMIFSKAYLKISDSEGGVFYITGLDSTNIIQWFAENTPNNGVNFTGFNIFMEIHFVYDKTLSINQISGHNQNYAIARGRKKYYSNTSRKSGLDSGFHNFTNPYNNFGGTLVQNYSGLSPLNLTNNQECIWYSKSKNLYNMPRISSSVKVNNRTIYNLTTRVFEQINTDTNMYVGEPIFFGNSYGDLTRNFMTMQSIFKDGNIIGKQYRGVLLFPLLSDDGNKLAFLMKPLGIDAVTFKFNGAGNSKIQIMSEIFRKSTHSIIYKQIPMLPAIDIDMVSRIYSVYSFIEDITYKFRTNEHKLPKEIKLFLVNVENGVRGEYADSAIVLEKRQINAHYKFIIQKQRV